MKRNLFSFVSLAVYRCVCIVAVMCFYTGAALAQCDNAILLLQAQVTNFSTDYPGCTNVGNLAISGNDITNLDGLSSIQAVNGALNIYNCPALTGKLGGG